MEEKKEGGSHMDIRKWEVFLKAVDLQSLTRAGEELGYTQSGVSHMMKSLEDELGFSLLIRKHQGVFPTNQGEQILPMVRELTRMNEKLEQTVSGIKGIQTGTLTIGSFSSISFHWLPRVMKKFQMQYPGITLKLMEGGVDEMEELMEGGKVDMAFFSRQPHHTFDWIALMKDPMMAVLPLGHPRSEGSRFPMKDFMEEPFVITAMGFDYDINGTLKNNGIQPEIQFSCMDDLTVISMVANGLGLSILPKLVLQGHENQVAAVPLSPAAHRELGIGLLSWKKASPAAKSFVEMAKRIWREDSEK
ncbi:MAG: LysR family transcriptional regulator, partial [Alphaproteobacteria bacterium]|nr:LysR family transcriptional regulator [Alphaproteobacteria bacterium]